MTRKKWAGDIAVPCMVEMMYDAGKCDCFPSDYCPDCEGWYCEDHWGYHYDSSYCDTK